MSFLCRIGWHRSEHRPNPKDEWAVVCSRCGRKGSWSLMSDRTTWEDPEEEALKKLSVDLEASKKSLEADEKALDEILRQSKRKMNEHKVKALVNSAKSLAHNEYARALALAARRKGYDVEVPPSKIGRLDD